METKHMALIEKYDRLVYELQERQAQIAHVSKAFYHEHQRLIDAAGVAVIVFEDRHGITEARHLVEHEKGFRGHLEQFEGMVATYSVPVDWPGEIAAVNIAAEDVESKMAERALVLAEAKKSVVTLKRMTADADQRRKKLSREALEIAERRDPLSGYERESFTQIFNYTKAERATNSALSGILQPV
jgi:hypothetical protein